MKVNEIKPGVVYRHKKTGHLGVLYLGYDYGCLSDDEVGMVYRGDDEHSEISNSYFVGTNPNNLEEYSLQSEDILTPKHIDEVCKRGQGNACCCYLVLNGKGFECARVSGSIGLALNFQDRIREGTMNAKSFNCGGRYNLDNLP